MDKKIEDALQMQKDEIIRLKQCMKTQTDETSQLLTSKIYANTKNINQLLEENWQLKLENTELRDKITKIERNSITT